MHWLIGMNGMNRWNGHGWQNKTERRKQSETHTHMRDGCVGVTINHHHSPLNLSLSISHHSPPRQQTSFFFSSFFLFFFSSFFFAFLFFLSSFFCLFFFSVFFFEETDGPLFLRQLLNGGG